jgi:hypothetical protein
MTAQDISITFPFAGDHNWNSEGRYEFGTNNWLMPISVNVRQSKAWTYVTEFKRHENLRVQHYTTYKLELVNKEKVVSPMLDNVTHNY